MKVQFVGLCLTFLFQIVFFQPSCISQTASTLIRLGDELAPGVTLVGIARARCNQVGGYAFSITPSSGLGVFWGNPIGEAGAVLRSQGTYGNFAQTGDFRFFGINNSGSIAYRATTTNTTTGQSGNSVWLDDTLIKLAGDPIAGLSGYTYGGTDRVNIMASTDQPYWVGWIVNSSGTAFNTLFRGTNSEIVLTAGGAVGGAVDPIKDGLGASFSSMGTNYLAHFNLDSSSNTNRAVALNGSILNAGGGLLRKGQMIPPSVGGLPGDTYANFQIGAINDIGDYILKGVALTASGASDDFLMVNGKIELREGNDVNGLILTEILGGLQGSAINSSSDWAAAARAEGSVDLLILNGKVVLAEGDLVDWNGDGMIDLADQGYSFMNVGDSGLSERRLDGTIDLIFDAGLQNSLGQTGAAMRMSINVIPEPNSIPILVMMCCLAIWHSSGYRRRAIVGRVSE